MTKIEEVVKRMVSYAHSPSPNPLLPIKQGFTKRVCVYGICKDESHNIEKYMEWAKEADGVFFLDTGSQDGTQDKIKKLGGFIKEEKIDPWRFDEAKNKAMGLVPNDADFCVCFNLDEQIKPIKGWRKILEEAWKGDINMLQYQYIFSHKPDGSNGVTFWFNAIHDRKNFIWHYPTHEVLTPIPNGKPARYANTSLECHHFRPHWKLKSNDLKLLEMGMEENPQDARIVHYYGRELYYHSTWDKAIEIFDRHTKLNCWPVEKAASYYLGAQCYEKLGNKIEAEKWYLKACAEAPELREFWVYLGRFYMNNNHHGGGYFCAKRALEIEEKIMNHYICNDMDWTCGPWDLISVCAWYMGLREESKQAVEKAIAICPFDERIQRNHRFITENIGK